MPTNSSFSQTLDRSAFPVELASFIDAVTKQVQAPYEMGVGHSLASVSAMVQGKFAVRVKPGYVEPLSFCSLTVAESSERKGPVARKISSLLVNIQQQHNRSTSSERQAKQSRFDSKIKLIAGLRRRLARSSEEWRDDLMDEIAQLEADLSPPDAPLSLVTQDTTSAAAAALMVSQPGERLLIMDAESGAFDSIKKDEQLANLVIKGYDNDHIDIDRKTCPSIYLAAPVVSVSVMVQPVVIARKKHLDRLQYLYDHGLFPRCAVIFPPSALGTRDFSCQPNSNIPKQEWFKSRLEALFRFEWNKNENGETVPYILRFSDDARWEWEQFGNQCESKMKSGASLHYLRAWLGKLPGMVARIATIYHCLENNDPTESAVSQDNVIQACKLASALVPHMERFHAMLFPVPEEANVEKIREWILNFSDPYIGFTARDIGKSKGWVVADIIPCLNYLASRGAIFRLADYGPMPGVVGRPGAPRYSYTPDMLNGFAYQIPQFNYVNQ